MTQILRCGMPCASRWFNGPHLRGSSYGFRIAKRKDRSRVSRGGGWPLRAIHYQLAYREYDEPVVRFSSLGFRIARK